MAVFDNLTFRYCPSLDTSGNGTSTLFNLDGVGSQVGSNNATLLNTNSGNWVSDTSNGGVRALDLLGSIGSQQHIVFPNMLNGRGDFTLCFWMYRRTFSSPQIRMMCATGGFGTNMQASYTFTLNFFSNSYGVEAYIPFSGGYGNSPTTFSNNVWKFIAVVRSGTTLRLYIDNDSNLITGVPGGTMQVNYPVLSNNHEVNSSAFDGRLDDICFFNVAKNSDDLAALASQRGYLVPPVPEFSLKTSTLPTQVIGINKITNVSHIGVEVLGDMVQEIFTKTSTIPTQVVGTNKIANVTHLGVEILGANAAEPEFYTEEGSGGVVASGQIIFSSNEIASGGVALNGEFIENFFYNETASGGVALNGEFVVEKIRDLSDVASGGVVSSGESIVTAIQTFNEIASGGVEVSGTLRNRFKKSLGFKCEKSQNDIGLSCLKCIDEDDKDLIDIVTMRYLQIETPRNRLDRVGKFSGAYLPSITICRQKLFED